MNLIQRDGVKNFAASCFFFSFLLFSSTAQTLKHTHNAATAQATANQNCRVQSSGGVGLYFILVPMQTPQVLGESQSPSIIGYQF